MPTANAITQPITVVPDAATQVIDQALTACVNAGGNPLTCLNQIQQALNGIVPGSPCANALFDLAGKNQLAPYVLQSIQANVPICQLLPGTPAGQATVQQQAQAQANANAGWKAALWTGLGAGLGALFAKLLTGIF